MFELKGKVALVTGGQQGMGKADALALARQGAIVAVTDIDQAKCESVAQEITASGGQASAYKMDVTSEQEVDSIISQVVEKYGRLDILVNNAGIFFAKPALELTEDEWEKVIHVNLKGQFICAKRAAKEMMKNKWGRIINIASIASGGVGVGVMGAAHYSASKGGIIGMTETLAIEWAQLGITVNAIGPGAIDTPMLGEARTNSSVIDAMMAGVPMKRVGKPEEIAAAVVFLASEEASYVTGATLYVDGGWLAA